MITYKNLTILFFSTFLLSSCQYFLGPAPKEYVKVEKNTPRLHLQKDNIYISHNSSINLGSFLKDTTPPEISFTLYNYGKKDLYIKEIQKNSSDTVFSLNYNSIKNIYIKPQTSQSFTITISTLNTGQFSAEFNIINSDPQQKKFIFAINTSVTTNTEPNIQIISPNSSEIAENANPGFDFEEIKIGSYDTQTFTINNIGTANLDINNISSSNSVFTVTQISSVINPGQNNTFTIKYSPDTAILQKTTITINNNDPNKNPFVFYAEGTGVGSKIEVYRETDLITQNMDPAYDYKEVLINNSITIPFTVKNVGAIELNVDSISSSNSMFTVTQITTPIAPNSDINFNITFTPTVLSLQKSQITVANDDPNLDPFIFYVEGTGSNEIYVKEGSNGDGSKENPFNNLKEAVDRAQTGNEIRVAKGNYEENLSIEKEIKILGGFNLDWTRDTLLNPALTQIKAEEKDSPVIELASGSGNTIISGFTIATSSESADSKIAVLITESSSLNLEENVILVNTAIYKTYAILIQNNTGSPIINRNEIIGGHGPNYTAGIKVEMGSPTLTVTNNTITTHKGSTKVDQAHGISIETGNAIIRNNTIKTVLGTEAFGISLVGNHAIHNNIIFSNNDISGEFKEIGIKASEGTTNMIQNNNIFDCGFALFFHGTYGKITDINALNWLDTLKEGNISIDLTTGSNTYFIDEESNWRLKNGDFIPNVKKGGRSFSAKNDKDGNPHTNNSWGTAPDNAGAGNWTMGAYESDI